MTNGSASWPDPWSPVRRHHVGAWICATRPTRQREEIIAACAPRAAGRTAGAYGLIVIMWRAGLHIQAALALTEGDLDQRRG